MLLTVLQSVLRRTLASVVFGISLMVLTAVYVAVGSGMPSLRAYFEMSDLQFFNAWPLKVLMAMLVVNLTIVTWTRIPFTPPRYGVWCVHAGIIILIFGTARYYRFKVEGLTRIPVGATVGHFYEREAPALYVRASRLTSEPSPLPSLPRFHAYSAESGNDSRLDREDLRSIDPYFRTFDPTSGEQRAVGLARALGLADLRIAVVGYWPYAQVVSDFVEDPSASGVGVRLTMSDPHTRQPITQWLVASTPPQPHIVFNSEIEHRHLSSQSEVASLAQAASNIHELQVKLGDDAQTLFVEPGKTYPLHADGYSIEVESFDPAWR
ncbi:MAG: hypothetical protein ACREJC_16700, partial [Tepidisphaeraceae bacterium]